VFGVSGVSKRKLGGMHDDLKIQRDVECGNAGFGIKLTGPEQLMFISTRKCEINLILSDGM